MSEFRDLTVALRSLSDRMTTIEDCMLVLVRNSEQEKDWRHEQRNIAMVTKGEAEEREQALLQIQQWMGPVNDNLNELVERFDNFVATRFTDVKSLNDRVRDLEQEVGISKEEITKP
jgi:hypothetical protein